MSYVMHPDPFNAGGLGMGFHRKNVKAGTALRPVKDGIYGIHTL